MVETTFVTESGELIKLCASLGVSSSRYENEEVSSEQSRRKLHLTFQLMVLDADL